MTPPYEDTGFALTNDEIVRHKRIADTVWNLLGMQEPEVVEAWLRGALDELSRGRGDGEGWKA